MCKLNIKIITEEDTTLCFEFVLFGFPIQGTGLYHAINTTRDNNNGNDRTFQKQEQ